MSPSPLSTKIAIFECQKLHLEKLFPDVIVLIIGDYIININVQKMLKCLMKRARKLDYSLLGWSSINGEDDEFPGLQTQLLFIGDEKSKMFEYVLYDLPCIYKRFVVDCSDNYYTHRDGYERKKCHRLRKLT